MLCSKKGFANPDLRISEFLPVLNLHLFPPEFLQCLLRLNACQERGVRLADCRGVDLCSETTAAEAVEVAADYEDDDNLLQRGQ